MRRLCVLQCLFLAACASDSAVGPDSGTIEDSGVGADIGVGADSGTDAMTGMITYSSSATVFEAINANTLAAEDPCAELLEPAAGGGALALVNSDSVSSEGRVHFEDLMTQPESGWLIEIDDCEGAIDDHAGLRAISRVPPESYLDAADGASIDAVTHAPGLKRYRCARPYSPEPSFAVLDVMSRGVAHGEGLRFAYLPRQKRSD